jgi:ankyrin repeat protein
MADNNEHRALHHAVLDRAPQMVRLLMQHGADARKGIYPHRDATSALTIATERGYDEIVAIIQEEEQHRREAMSGSYATVTNTQDELSEAIGRGHEARAVAILEADPALVHACDRDGWTPLHVAAAVLNERIVVWLLERGADVTRRGKDDRTPLDLAATGTGRRKAASAEQFAAVAGMLRRRGAELTARSAVALDEADWLRARHAEGVLVNPIDWTEGGLLTIAVMCDLPDILALLLDLGLDPDERVRSGDVEDAIYSQGCAAQG